MRHAILSSGHGVPRSPERKIDDFLRSMSEYVRATVYGVPRMIHYTAGNVILDVDVPETVAELAARIERSVPAKHDYLHYELARVRAIRSASHALNVIARDALLHYAQALNSDLERLESNGGRLCVDTTPLLSSTPCDASSHD